MNNKIKRIITTRDTLTYERNVVIAISNEDVMKYLGINQHGAMITSCSVERMMDALVVRLKVKVKEEDLIGDEDDEHI